VRFEPGSGVVGRESEVVEALSRRDVAREVVEALAVSLSSSVSNLRLVVASATGSWTGLEAMLSGAETRSADRGRGCRVDLGPGRGCALCRFVYLWS
jgi:hypothetical protein